MLYNLLEIVDDQMDEMGLYRLVQVLYQLEFRAFFSVVFSFLLVILFGDRMIRWLLKQKIGDAPEFYNKDLNELTLSKAATPTMGGLLICAAILATIVLFADLRSRYVWLAVVVLIWLTALGGWDDWMKLTSARRNPGSREGAFAWEKLLFQLGIAFIAGYYLFTMGQGSDAERVLTIPFQRTYVPKTLELESTVIVLGALPFIAIAVLMIAGTSNAVNLTDGMDGLAPGGLVIASLAMMVLCYIAGSEDAARTLMFPHVPAARDLMVVCGAMSGACLGFLWFNCAPARVFMGDTGSLPLGGLLAYVAVAIRQEFLLIIIGGVFFLEMGSVIAQVGYFKATGGKRIFKCAPVHHHFHLSGWSEPQVVTRFWVLGVICAMLALVSLKLR